MSTKSMTAVPADLLQSAPSARRNPFTLALTVVAALGEGLAAHARYEVLRARGFDHATAAAKAMNFKA